MSSEKCRHKLFKKFKELKGLFFSVKDFLNTFSDFCLLAFLIFSNCQLALFSIPTRKYKISSFAAFLLHGQISRICSKFFRLCALVISTFCALFIFSAAFCRIFACLLCIVSQHHKSVARVILKIPCISV